MNNKFTCIIPFFNEGTSLLTILRLLLKIKEIDQIICVDDGSENNLSEKIKKLFPQIILIRLEENEGKTEAVAKGLLQAKNESILLLDADLEHVNPKDIEFGLEKFQENEDLDMIIFKRINEIPHGKILRWDVLLSGERIIRKKDLEEILKENISGYQLELAMNDYMFKNKKKVNWVPSSGKNYWKIKRRGFLKGIILEARAGISILQTISVKNQLLQTFLFCKEEVKNL